MPESTPEQRGDAVIALLTEIRDLLARTPAPTMPAVPPSRPVTPRFPPRPSNAPPKPQNGPTGVKYAVGQIVGYMCSDGKVRNYTVAERDTGRGVRLRGEDGFAFFGKREKIGQPAEDETVTDPRDEDEEPVDF